MTEVQIVTVFTDGHGEGLGAIASTMAANEGVTEQAGEVVVPIAAQAGGPVGVTTVGVPANITPAPSLSPSGTAPLAGDCDQCSIYFQYINAYFWPTENTNNTACLAGVTEEANGPIPTNLTPYVQLPKLIRAML